MDRRKITIGTYDTALDGLWTLTGWSFSAPVMESYFVDVPGRKAGPLDLSTALTDGEPTYGSRTFKATLESSEGTYLERAERIDTMINWLDGWRLQIVLPDDPDHYIIGRVSVEKEYNDMAHCAVTVTAICEPWRYNQLERVLSFDAPDARTVTIRNTGRMTVVPLLVVSGEDAAVSLAFGGASWTLGAGTYQLPDLVLRQGDAQLTYSGTGSFTLTYREAVL